MRTVGSRALALLISAQVALCLVGVASVLLRERAAADMSVASEVTELAGRPDQARS